MVNDLNPGRFILLNRNAYGEVGSSLFYIATLVTAGDLSQFLSIVIDDLDMEMAGNSSTSMIFLAQRAVDFQS